LFFLLDDIIVFNKSLLIILIIFFMSHIILLENRLFKIIFIFLLSFVFVNSYAYASDYYVSSIRDGRSDSNSGTDPNRPWATMDKVASMWDNSIKAGDTVHLERGSVWIWKPASAEPYLHTDIGGNSSAPMVIIMVHLGRANLLLRGIHQTGLMRRSIQLRRVAG
jgi:hypothetical protein